MNYNYKLHKLFNMQFSISYLHVKNECACVPECVELKQGSGSFCTISDSYLYSTWPTVPMLPSVTLRMCLSISTSIALSVDWKKLAGI